MLIPSQKQPETITIYDRCKPQGLPEDILHTIFSCLEETKDHSSFALTCKDWYNVTINGSLLKSVVQFLLKDNNLIETGKNRWAPLQEVEKGKIITCQRRLKKTALPFLENHYKIESKTFHSLFQATLFPLPYNLRKQNPKHANLIWLKEKIKEMEELYQILPEKQCENNNPFIADYKLFRVLILQSEHKQENLYLKIRKYSKLKEDLSYTSNLLVNLFNQKANLMDNSYKKYAFDPRFKIASFLSNPIGFPSHLDLKKDSLYCDKELILFALTINSNILCKAHFCLSIDQDIALASLRVFPLSAQHIYAKIGSHIWIQAMEENWAVFDAYLRYHGKNGIDNEEILLYAVRKQWHQIKHATPKLKCSEPFMLKAVSINGLCLEWADKSIKNNKAVVRAAVLNDPKARQFASDNLKRALE